MNHTLRVLAAGTFLTALVVAGAIGYPGLAADGDGPGRSIVDWQPGVATTRQEARALARREAELVRRSARRFRTVEDLLAGRIAPEDALARFVELNRSSPLALRRVREQFPGDTDEERAVWQLVAHVRVQPDPRAEDVADETACRLAYPPK